MSDDKCNGTTPHRGGVLGFRLQALGQKRVVYVAVKELVQRDVASPRGTGALVCHYVNGGGMRAGAGSGFIQSRSINEQCSR
jgi:hypothetical protein